MGLDAYEQLAVDPGAVGDVARSILETPSQPGESYADTQYRSAQQAGATARIQAIKGKQWAARGVPSYQDMQGNTKPVVDDTGSPLNKLDPKHNIAYDSTGSPKKIDFDVAGGSPVLKDPFEGLETTTDPKTGHQYQIAPGLPWRWVGTDAQTAQKAEFARQDADLSKASAALGRKLTLTEYDEKFHSDAINDVRSQLKQLSVADTDPVTGDPLDYDGLVAGINSQFDDLKKNDTTANAKEYFGMGGYKPEALKAQADLDLQRTAALRAAAKGHAHAQALGGIRQQAEAVRAQRMMIEQTKLDHETALLKAQGIDISQPVPQLDDSGAVQPEPDDNTTLDGKPLPPAALALRDAQAGKKPYKIDKKFQPQFSAEHPYDELMAMKADGLVDAEFEKKYADKFKEAQDHYAQIVKDAGGASQAKALIHGMGPAAAFMAGFGPGAAAGSAVGSGIGAAIGGAVSAPTAGLAAPGTVPVGAGIGAGIGSVIGGLAAGSVAAWATHKAMNALGKYSDVMKSLNASAEMHPILDEVGGLLAFSTGAPKAIANLSKVGKIANTSRAAAIAAGVPLEEAGMTGAKVIAGQLARGAVGGLAFEGLARPGFDATVNLVADGLGIDHEQLQTPTVKSLAVNAALGVLLAGKHIEFKDYNAQEVASVAFRGQMRKAMGVDYAAPVDPATVSQFAEKAGMTSDQVAQMSQPMNPQEAALYEQIGKQVDAMKKAGSFDNLKLSKLEAQQAFIPGLTPGKGTAITSATIGGERAEPGAPESRAGLGAPEAPTPAAPAGERNITPQPTKPKPAEPGTTNIGEKLGSELDKVEVAPTSDLERDPAKRAQMSHEEHSQDHALRGQRVVEADRELEMVKELGGTKEQIAAAEKKLRDARDDYDASVGQFDYGASARLAVAKGEPLNADTADRYGFAKPEGYSEAKAADGTRMYVKDGKPAASAPASVAKASPEIPSDLDQRIAPIVKDVQQRLYDAHEELRRAETQGGSDEIITEKRAALEAIRQESEQRLGSREPELGKSLVRRLLESGTHEWEDGKGLREKSQTITTDDVERVRQLFAEHGKESVSLIQRKMRLGYTKAFALFEAFQKSKQPPAPNEPKLPASERNDQSQPEGAKPAGGASEVAKTEEGKPGGEPAGQAGGKPDAEAVTRHRELATEVQRQLREVHGDELVAATGSRRARIVGKGEAGGAGLMAVREGGKIEILVSPEDLLKSLANVEEKNRAAFLEKAIQEEVMHTQTLAAANERDASGNLTERAKRFSKGLEQLPTTEKGIVEGNKEKGIVGLREQRKKTWDKMSEIDKGHEILRVIMQGRDNPGTQPTTESTWDTIKAFVEWLKSHVKNLSASSKKLLSDLESWMAKRKQDVAEAPSEKSKHTLGTGKPNGVKAEGHYDIVEAADLGKLVQTEIGDAQNRDRKNNQASKEQIEKIRQKPDASMLGKSPVSLTGAPTIDGEAVLAGNGRAIGLIQAWQTNPEGIAEYRDKLNALADELGLGDRLAGKQQPVLVFRATKFENGDRKDFVNESNPRNVGLGENTVEAALRDYDVLANHPDQIEFLENGNLSQESLRMIGATLDNEQRGVKRDPKGNYDLAEGTKRVQAAMLAGMAKKAGIDYSTLSDIMQSDFGKRALGSVLSRSGKLATLDADLSLANPIMEALRDFQTGLAAVKSSQYESLPEWYANRKQELIREPISEEGEELLSLFARSHKSAKELNAFLDDYITAATAEQKERAAEAGMGSMFGDERAKTSPLDIIKRIGAAKAPEADTDLFDEAGGGKAGNPNVAAKAAEVKPEAKPAKPAKKDEAEVSDEEYFGNILRMATDKPNELRVPDVDRVMSAVKPEEVEKFRAWLLDQGPFKQQGVATEITTWTAEEPAAPKEYAYGMQNRPRQIGAQPKDFSRVDENDKRGRHGVIFYNRKLTADEIYSFELKELGESPEPAAPKEDIVLQFENGAKVRVKGDDSHEFDGVVTAPGPFKRGEPQKFFVKSYMGEFVYRADQLKAQEPAAPEVNPIPAADEARAQVLKDRLKKNFKKLKGLEAAKPKNRLQQLHSAAQERALTLDEQVERETLERAEGQGFMDFAAPIAPGEVAAKKEADIKAKAKAAIEFRLNRKLVGGNIETQTDAFGPQADEGGNLSLFAEKPEKQTEPAPAFYSQLTKTVQAIPQLQMTVQQARAAIEKGAKKDEIAMSGILTDPLSPLAGKQPGDKVTKAELTGYALERQATVQEVVLQPVSEEAKQRLRRATSEVNRYPLASLAMEAGMSQLDAANLPGRLADGRTAIADLPELLQPNAERYIEILTEYRAARVASASVPESEQTHFSQYQLPGADEGSYREMFVTWPAPEGKPSDKPKFPEPLTELPDGYEFIKNEKQWGVIPPGQNHGRPFAGYHASQEAAKQTALDDLNFERASRYRSELDDWKSQGVKWNDGHGQYSDIANPIVRIRRNLRTDADGKRTYFIEEMQGPGKGEQEKMPPELRKRIYEIGMKRALRDAVDEGADAIAWTTGEQQVTRYEDSIVEHVDEVSVSRGGALGKWEVWATKDGRQVVSKTVETLQEVDGLIGKELAEKVSDMKAGDFQRRFSGLDLKVGGEGLKHTYDVRLPNLKFIQDLEKKFGVKVGTAEVSTPKRSKRVDDLTDAELLAELHRSGDTTTVHSLPIPEALKTQQRTQGSALFAEAPTAGATDRQKKMAAAAWKAKGVESSYFKKWQGKAELYRIGDDLISAENGKPVLVEGFHGTTHDFAVVDPSKANVENDMGQGFYVTNTPEDVQENYAGEGPDLTNRIERKAEQLDSEVDGMEPEEMVEQLGISEYDASVLVDTEPYSYGSPQAESRTKILKKIARKELTQHGGATMKVFVKLENPLKLGENEPYWDSESPADENGDPVGEPIGKMIDFLQAIRNESRRDVDLSALEDAAMDGMKAGKAIAEAKKALGDSEDDNGNLNGNEIIRTAIERMGYDGILDGTVDEKFGYKKGLGKPMKGVGPSTVHVIAFWPEQVKSATGNRGTFTKGSRSMLEAEAPEKQKQLEFAGEIFTDAVQLGAHYIQTGSHRFTEWAEKMREDCGPQIEKYLKSIYETAKVTIESPRGESVEGRPPGLERGLRPPTERIVTARAEHTQHADESVIPDELKPHLDEHQRQGAAAGIASMEKIGGFLNADGTGAGKTRQALTVASHFAKQGKRVVIVTKAETIKQDWAKNTFGGSYGFDSKAMGIPLDLARDGNVKPGKIGITTYQNLSDVDRNSGPDTVLIFDEAHALKNDSQQAKYGMSATQKANKVMFMSATPADKAEHIYYLAGIGIMEGKTVQKALEDLGMKLITVKKRDKSGRPYEVKFWAPDGKVSDTERNRRFSALFNRMTAKGAMIKREISMEGVHVNMLRVSLPPEGHDVQQDILRHFDATHIDDLQGLKRAIVLGHMRRQQEPFKIASTVMLAQRELDQGRQVVIFVSRVNASEVGKWVKGLDGERYRDILMSSEGTAKSLAEAMRDAGIHDIAEIHGNADQNSLEAMADFQSGKKRVVIATIESGGTGINLDDIVGNRPRSMIIVTAPFDAVGNVQAAGRIWRLKTLSGANLFYLFGNTDVDEWNKGIIGSKMAMLGAVVEGQVRKLDVSDPEQVSLDDFHSSVAPVSNEGSPRGEMPEGNAFPMLDWKPFKTRAGKDKFVAEATPEFWKWWKANGERNNPEGVSLSKWDGKWQVWSDREIGSTELSAAAPEQEARTEDRLSNYSDERLAKQIPTKPVQREWMNRGVFPSTLVHQPTPREQFAFKRKLESLKKARATHSDSASSIAADMHDMVNEMVPEGVPFFRIHGDIFDVDGLGISGKASQIKTFPEIAETFSAAAPERRAAEQDREYLAAVKRGDMETAQRMGDRAAIAAGAHTNADGSVQHFIRGGNERGKTVFPGASFWTLDTEAGRKVAEGYRDSAGDFLGRKIPDAERKAKNADIFRMYRELPEPLKKGHALAAAMHAHGRGSDVSRYYNESAEQTFERVRQLVIKMAKEERWPHPEITQALKDKDWDKVLELSEPHVYLAFEANPIGMTNGEVRDQLTSREQKHRYDALTSRANYFAPFKSITRAYLMFKNPLRLNGTGAITPQSVEQARKDGYDAIWSEGAVGGDTLGRDNRIPEVVVLSAEQVKSADPSTIPLSERFNPESDSILSAAAPERRATDAVAAGAKGREDTKEDRKAARAATMTTKPAGVASQIWDAIKGAGSATKRWWGEMPAYDSIDKAIGQWLGAGDTAPLKGTDIVIPGRQKAAHEARKLVETIVKQFPNVLTRQAISRYMEADGDKTTLQKWADQSKPETKAVYERALNLNAAEKAMAATATTFFKEKGEEAQKLGLLGNLLENYVTHFVEKAPANQRSGLMARILGDLASDTPASKLKTKFDHAIKRVFASMFDLEREGHSLRGGGDIAGTLGAYAQAANNTVADRVFVKSLTDIMARDGRPMAVPSGAITRTDGSADSPLLIKPHTHPADTSDYRPIAHPALRKWKWIGKEGEKDVLVEGELLIHPDLYKRLRNTLGTSALNNVPIIKAVGEFQGIVKQFMLSFSPFHFVQEGTHAIGHKVNPFKVVEIDMEDPATRELVNAGLMLANWNAKAEFGEGLTANSMEKFLSHVGLGKLGKLNDTMSAFLFERYIPGLKIAMAKEAMVRNMERFKKELASGKMTREQVAQKTAQQANDAFGEQNNLYAGNNPTRLHIERLLFLAPDFLKSRAKFFADAFRKRGGEQRHALILLAVVLAVTAKLLERMLTGKNDWEKPFSVVTEGREYELRSVPGDVIALLKNRRQFVMGRISPLISRTALEAATGRDWRGVQRSAGQQVKDLAMVPLPLALRGVIDPEAPNISTAESLISSSGLRTIRHSEITKARMLGREWQKANGSDHVDEVHPPSKYVGMKNALEDGDDARAMKEYGKLLATMPKEKADTGFRSSLMKPFSGSLANEKAFAASLSGDDRATYQAAMTKRGRMLAAFTRMSATTRAPISAPKAKPSGGSSRALTAKEFFR